MKRIAIVCAQGLGDGLITMVLSRAFFLSGCDVATFSTPLTGLKRWFPNHKILPFPHPSALHQDLIDFDQIIASDHSLLAACKDKRVALIEEKRLDLSQSYAANLSILAKERFGLHHGSPSNGMTVPKEVAIGKFTRRVVVHPEAADQKKIWPQKKFIALMRMLADDGWECSVCTAPQERSHWEWILSHSPYVSFPKFASLDALAAHVAQSAFFIGNDSGVGHLASALGIPTLSIFAKKRYACLWRPAWSEGWVVTPPSLPIGGRLRQNLWKVLLNPRRVYRAFQKFAKQRGKER